MYFLCLGPMDTFLGVSPIVCSKDLLQNKYAQDCTVLLLM